jgi:hypothetical protein
MFTTIPARIFYLRTSSDNSLPLPLAVEAPPNSKPNEQNPEAQKKGS